MIKLLLHHILVKMDDATEADEMYKRAKAAGIELALDKREQAAVQFGTVIQIGPTAYVDLGGDRDCLSVGDRVSLTRYAGKSIVDSDGVEYYIFNDSDVLAIVN